MKMFDFDWTKEGEKERHQSAFDEGVREGENNGFLGGLFHDLGETATVIVPKSTEHQSYEAGYREGEKQSAGAQPHPSSTARKSCEEKRAKRTIAGPRCRQGCREWCRVSVKQVCPVNAITRTNARGEKVESRAVHVASTAAET
jgi:hypothetical protein